MAKVAYEIYENEINGLTFLNAYYLEIRIIYLIKFLVRPEYS
jgi:hypothetical protein